MIEFDISKRITLKQIKEFIKDFYTNKNYSPTN